MFKKTEVAPRAVNNISLKRVQELLNRSEDPRVNAELLAAGKNDLNISRAIQQRDEVLDFIDATAKKDKKSLALATRFINTHSRSINDKNSIGDTALLTAVKNENIPVVRLLLEHGADVGIKDVEDLTAEQIAFKSTNPELIMIFRTHQSEKFLDDVAQLKIEAVKSYLSSHQGYNAINYSAKNSWNTALMIAASQGNKMMVQLLLQSGADGSLANKEKLTAEDLALNQGHVDIANYIAAYPAIQERHKTKLSFQQRFAAIGLADDYPQYQDNLHPYEILENPIPAFGMHFDYNNLTARFEKTKLITCGAPTIKLDRSVLRIPVNTYLKNEIKATIEQQEELFEIKKVAENRKAKSEDLPHPQQSVVETTPLSIQSKRMAFFADKLGQTGTAFVQAENKLSS